MRRFHEYRCLRDSMAARDATYHRATRRAFYEHYQSVIAKPGFVDIRQPAERSLATVIACESDWVRGNRPFYNVYPAVVKCLKNTSLRISLSQIGNVNPVAICFAVGHEQMMDGQQVVAMILDIGMSYKTNAASEEIAKPIISFCIDKRDSHGETFRQGIFLIGDQILDNSREELDAQAERLLRIAIGIALLARDDRFVEPILLQRDRDRKFATKESHDNAVARAIRRGVNGCEIGKTLEVSPHVRRPHFGIRWTEKGHSVPKLVPIGGCVVRKSHLYPIPTGYMDGDSEAIA